MKEIIDKAIDRYGITHQIIVAIEEMSELTKELTKCLRKNGNIDHLIEELADVYIVLEEIKEIFNVPCDALEGKMREKLDRLNKRLEGSAE